ncbi:MAG: tetratricopeptide repeat protein [Pseudomonadota bacterium]
MSTPDRTLQAAATLLGQGRAAEAAQLANRVLQAWPRHVDARRLLAYGLRDLGDLAGAERELRAAMAADRRQPLIPVELAELLIRAGREADGEKLLRAALALDRRCVPAAEMLGRLLIARGRSAEALKVLTPLTAAGDNPVALSVHGEALRALGRYDEAAGLLRRIQSGPHAEPVFAYNLAAVLCDAERFEEAETAVAGAIADGMATPEAHRLRGLALQGLGRFDEAEAAFREALRKDPVHPTSHRDLAHLLWRREEDVGAATAALDRALAVRPGEGALRVVKAKVLEYAGDLEGAYAALAPIAGRGSPDPVVELSASQVAVGLDPDRALAHAERALAAAPDEPLVRAVAAEACLAAGRPEAAAGHAEALLAIAPADQQALGLLALAWRMLDDPRYADLYDYDAFVKTYRLEPPAGWSSLEAWLADLARALDGLHGLKAHPIGQSLRQGSQTTQSLDHSPDPAVRGFFEAIQDPIARHIAGLGRGRDPLRARATGRFRLSGSWSVRLRPGGRHVPHLHPKGWLSSALYVALPDAVGTGREGWIAFGEAGLPTRPPLPPERWVRPEPGLLVLFPSYMWHGTVPFGGDQPRLTCAFDVVPA